MKKETKIQHRSFSSFTSWLRCGKAWQLQRELQAPEEPAWWSVGGSAFHTSVEKYLLNQFDNLNKKHDMAEVPF
jgi:hypothetical protein